MRCVCVCVVCLCVCTASPSVNIQWLGDTKCVYIVHVTSIT